jgi:SAM-dependent methyltransferase
MTWSPGREEISTLAGVKKRLYDDEAEHYDANRFRSPEGQFYEELANRQIFDLLGDARSGSILDVATGTGRIAIGLASRGLKIMGVDISEAMLGQARRKAERAGLSAIFRSANAAALPFDDGSFDGVVSFRFLHIMNPRQQAPFIAEMIRVLKPGGTLVVELNNALPHLWRNVSKRDPSVVVWPWEIRPHLGHGRAIDVVDVVGIGLPGIGRLSRYSQDLSRAIGVSLQRGPFAYLGRQVAVKAIKKQHASRAA